MNNNTFKMVLEKFRPYREHIQYLSMQGWGEPLLDNRLAEKVKIAKEMGFKGTGFATNCTALDERISLDLIGAGLDTILCGIDGINKHTHEAVRVGTDFEKIVSNVKNFIKIRNESKSKTRIIIRFIIQEINKKEWPPFLDYWSRQVNKGFGDEVVKFDIHNCAGSIDGYEDMDPNRGLSLGDICEELFIRILIFSNGEIGFCNADIDGFFKLGNIANSDPIKVFNNEIFNHYRKMMREGKILNLKHCKDCTLPRSRALKKEG
jgi:MoaA/NifB/PqqE/SkfB family radical SAM enzyme